MSTWWLFAPPLCNVLTPPLGGQVGNHWSNRLIGLISNRFSLFIVVFIIVHYPVYQYYKFQRACARQAFTPEKCQTVWSIQRNAWMINTIYAWLTWRPDHYLETQSSCPSYLANDINIVKYLDAFRKIEINNIEKYYLSICYFYIIIYNIVKSKYDLLINTVCMNSIPKI